MALVQNYNTHASALERSKAVSMFQGPTNALPRSYLESQLNCYLNPNCQFLYLVTYFFCPCRCDSYLLLTEGYNNRTR